MTDKHTKGAEQKGACQRKDDERLRIEKTPQRQISGRLTAGGGGAMIHGTQTESIFAPFRPSAARLRVQSDEKSGKHFDTPGCHGESGH